MVISWSLGVLYPVYLGHNGSSRADGHLAGHVIHYFLGTKFLDTVSPRGVAGDVLWV
ncbi:MAG: hypothetical protein QNL12_10615 [Acidimicrobiia bacterium]|nr:hypothetical protein [Acidimicrobiia bacterium]MDX2467757.1 hypothetical protein [Acidimicrobiia bacterium]